jgi:hypothetical protein
MKPITVCVASILVLALSLSISPSQANSNSNQISARASSKAGSQPQAWYEPPKKECTPKRDKTSCVLIPKTGLSVNRGGQIFTDINTTVEVMCAERKSRFVEPNNSDGVPINELCGSAPNPHIGPVPVVFRRGGSNSSIPYTVSPRYSIIRSQTPSFRWNSVHRAKKYTFSLVHDRSQKPICIIDDIENVPKRGIISVDFSLCQQRSQLKQLELGQFYRFRVQALLADGIISSNDQEVDPNDSNDQEVDPNDYRVETRGVEQLEFKLITPQDEEELRDTIKLIRREIQGKEEQVFSIASVYTTYGLYSEAILLLEELVEEGSKTPDVYELLGDYYASSGLLSLAESSYSQAKGYITMNERDIREGYIKVLDDKLDRVKRMKNSRYNRE